MIGHPYQTNRVDHYRISDVTIFPAGGNTSLIYVHSTRLAHLVNISLLDLLTQCREFRPLDEHLDAYCCSNGLDPTMRPSIKAALNHLVDLGCLNPGNVITKGWINSDRAAGPSRIKCIGFPTCDRVDLLKRSITSYIENTLHFGRDCEFVVVDDSKAYQTRDAYRRILKDLSISYGVTIAYAGLEEKLVFIQRLAEIGNCPADVIKYACLGDSRYGVMTVGANRNTLLLHTVGDLVLSADDDTVCRVVALADSGTGVSLQTGGNPIQIRAYPNRDSALQATYAVNRNILEIHENWLAQDLRFCLSDTVFNQHLALERASPRLLRQIGQTSGRIALTLNGMVGDCGWDNPYYYLFQRPAIDRFGETVEELSSTHSLSREVTQVAQQVTITEQVTSILTMTAGLDNTDLLPPFSPVGRGEEIVFATALSLLDATYIVHLPWLLLHAPSGPRAFSPPQLFGISHNTLAPLCIRRSEQGLEQPSTERLRDAGRSLIQVGQLSGNNFDEFVRFAMWNSMGPQIARLEEYLYTTKTTLPNFRSRQIHEYIASSRERALGPVDKLYLVEGGRKPIQQLLVRMGQVLSWWPEIIMMARHLRQEGQRLAQYL